MLFWKLFLQSAAFIFACVAIGEVLSNILKNNDTGEGNEL